MTARNHICFIRSYSILKTWYYSASLQVETSIAKTSSSKAVILASTVKFDLLRKIFCQKCFYCCQVRSAWKNILAKIFRLLPSSICSEKYSVKNISTAAKFDLLGKIFCQKYFDCCQGPRPSATVSGDFLCVQLHGCSLETCTPASPPARRELSTNHV